MPKVNIRDLDKLENFEQQGTEKIKKRKKKFSGEDEERPKKKNG